MRHFTFINIFLFAAPFLLQLLLADFPDFPPTFWGEGHTFWREKGVGESQFRRGDIYCGTLYINFKHKHKRLNACPLSRLSLDQSPVELTDGVGGGSGAKSQCIYKECLPPKFSLVPTCDGRGGGVVAIKKTWSSIINYCEKIRQKLYLHFTTW